MKDTFEFTLNNPLTEEQWDMITDVDFGRTDRITFHTKHGKEIEFAKVTRCKDCYFYGTFQRKHYCTKYEHSVKRDGFCAWAELKESEQ